MRFDNVSCSQCGRSFGPGDHGFSHCQDHPGHVQDMVEYKKRMLKIAETIINIEADTHPRLDEPDAVAFLLACAAGDLRNLILEMKPPRKRRKKA